MTLEANCINIYISNKINKSKIMNSLLSPFKWAGSKRKALPELHKRLPKEFNRYFECFLGGGSLFFSLAHSEREFILNDLNEELICAYNAIKLYPDQLFEHLLTHENTKEYYYKIRHLDRNEDFANLSQIERASRFIYLNKTSFNGLWRVNKNNQHNVSYGFYMKPAFPTLEHLKLCSKALARATITSNDFEAIKDQVKADDFIYLDPAYHPVSKTSSFTQYTKETCRLDYQLRIKDFCDHLNSIGAKFMLSNSVAPFVLETYKDYNISKIEMSRLINCKGDKRSKVNEVLVTNY